MRAREGIGLRVVITAFLIFCCDHCFALDLPTPGVMSQDTIKPCPLPSDPNNPSPVAGTVITAANPSTGLSEGFVLHTGSGNVIGDIISYNCDAPNFGDVNNPLTFGSISTTNTVVIGEVYFISSVTWLSCGELNSIVEISIGQPVIWSFDQALEVALVPTSTSINLCDGDIFNLEVSFSVPGHYDLTYVIDGLNPTTASFAVTSNNEVVELPIADSGTYCINNVTLTESTCPININSASCVLAKFYSRPQAVISDDTTVCAGSEHCFEIGLSGNGPFTVVMGNAAGNPTVYSGQVGGTFQHCVDVAGFYGIQELIDFNGCQPQTLPQFSELIVNNLPDISSASGNSQTICGSSCNEYILDVTSGLLPLSFTLQRPNQSDTIFEVGATPFSMEICSAGDYAIVQLEDANHCVSSDDMNWSVASIAVPNEFAGMNQEICLNENVTIGSIAVAGASYNWNQNALINTSFEQNSQIIITPIDTGSILLVLAMYKEGCSFYDTVEVYTHPLPNLSVQLNDNALCFGECVTAFFSGAAIYSWNTPFMEPSIINDDSLSICPDTTISYVFTGNIDYGPISCSSSQLVNINVSNAMMASVTTEEVCYGSCEGSASIMMSGGIPPYFSQSVDENFVASSLCPGLNYVVVSDAAGCVDSVEVFITERPQESVDFFFPQAPLCFGDETGEVNAFDLSADVMSLYMNDALFPFLTDETAPFNFVNLPAASYELVMTVNLDAMTCYDTINFTLESLSEPLEISVNQNNEPNCLQAQVCLEASVSGGLGYLTPHWNGCQSALNCESSQLNPFCFSINKDTIFYIHFTDQNNCSSDTLSVTAVLYDSLSVTILGVVDSALVCEYDCIDLLSASNGGNGNYEYDWNTIPQTDFLNPDSLGFKYCPEYTSPNHSIILTLSDNCVADVRDTLVITVKNTPDFFAQSNLYNQCVGSDFKLYYDLEPDFSDDYSCYWDFDNGTSAEICGDTVLVFSNPGTYIPTVVVTTEFGCVGRDTMNENIITVYPQPELDFSWFPEEVTTVDNKVQFICEPYGVDSVIWNFHNAFRSSLFDPYWSFPSVEASAPYFVCLIGFSGNRCLDTLCKDIFVLPAAQVFAPNSFTPDGDGLNDVFQPFVSGAIPESYSLTIYSRRGETIFFSKDLDAVWTGGINTNGYYVAPGSYIWRIEFLSKKTNSVEVFTGTVNLLR